jgi:hypothetical protein
MLLVIGTFRLAPAKFADANPLMALMIEASHAEDGCEEYTYASDVFDDGLITSKSDGAIAPLSSATSRPSTSRLGVRPGRASVSETAICASMRREKRGTRSRV